MNKGIRVTVEDLETGERDEREICNDYVIVTAGDCTVQVTAHANGTHVLTVKRPSHKGVSL